MFTRHLIIKRWKQEKRKFDTNIAIITKKVDAKAVHDSRISIKKLRAFLELYLLLNKDPEGDYSLSETEEFFDFLGKHSDIQKCLQLVALDEKENNRRYPELKQYLRFLRRKIQTWVGQSAHAWQKKELSRISVLLNKNKILVSEKKLIAGIQHHVDTRLADVKTYFRQPHQLRKKLKTIYYWAGLLPENTSGNGFDIKKLDHILHELGEWRDNDVLLTRTRHFRKDYLPKPLDEAALIKKLEENLKKKTEALLKSVLKETKELLKKPTN